MMTMSAFLHVSPSYVDEYACLLLCIRSIIYPHPTKAIHSDPPLISVENTYCDISHSFWQVSSSHSQAYSAEHPFYSVRSSTTTWGWRYDACTWTNSPQIWQLRHVICLGTDSIRLFEPQYLTICVLVSTCYWPICSPTKSDTRIWTARLLWANPSLSHRKHPSLTWTRYWGWILHIRSYPRSQNFRASHRSLQD